ncbi:hypothetical protein PIROE2DRAFT_68530 [Piromyces sp. E2]|nr:hypothetical protein PIROE2DRAFT_68530 [Piromyces sp. E2]|eukprot:OUM69466.1 hypothetical protein PIROE2DRAFT_68530 [Piromyces sp. E2]
MTHELLHGMGILTSLSRSFIKDFTHIFNVVSIQKDHPYLLPYFQYGYNGYFYAPVIKNILPLFIFDKYLNIYDQSSNYITPVRNYLSPLYESKKIKDNYVTLAIKEVENNLNINESASYLYNYALNSQWVFNKDDATIFQHDNTSQSNNKENSYIPIDTFVYNEWFDGLSGSHTQCDTFFHVARNKADGIICTFVNEGEQLFEKNSQLLGEKELTILSTLGWTVINPSDDNTDTEPTSTIAEDNDNNEHEFKPFDNKNQNDVITNNYDEEENDIDDEFDEYHLKKRNIPSSKKTKYHFANI